MKRWMSLLVLLALLTGCAASGDPNATQNSAAPETHTPPITVTQLPEGSYDRLAIMGSDLVVTAGTRLLLLSGDTLQEKAAITIPQLENAQKNDLQLGRAGVACYDRTNQTLYFWDAALQEVGHTTLADGVIGSVYLTTDFDILYYCTADGIYALDMDTGITRSLTRKAGSWLGVEGSILQGEVLLCPMAQADGGVTTVMISARTGEALAETAATDWSSAGQLYFCKLTTEGVTEYICGTGEDQPKNLLAAEDAQVAALPQGGIALTWNGSKLNCYDLETGMRIAANSPKHTPDMDSFIWFKGCTYYLSGSLLCRWDTERSGVVDDGVYLRPRYTREDPDQEGMDQRVLRTDVLEKMYGVNILLWEEVTALQPEGWEFSVGYIPEEYDACLTALSDALSRFDREFLTKAAQWTPSGRLNIVLVRRIQTASETAHPVTDGIQYLSGGDAYIVLTLDGKTEETFYHSLWHILDIVVMSNSTALYEWDALNPRDFRYDYDYAENAHRDGSPYLQEGKEAFIDTFSMSYPVEDRAAIFACAVQSGNESRFASKTVQKKLKTLSKGLREALELTGESHIWEQYIHE